MKYLNNKSTYQLLESGGHCIWKEIQMYMTIYYKFIKYPVIHTDTVVLILFLNIINKYVIVTERRVSH